MTEQEEQYLKMEIDHIFNSGANKIRVFEMVKTFISTHKEAMNFTHCCTQLKGKEAIPFEEWAEREGYENKWTGFWKEGKSVTYWTVKNRYNTYRNNL